MNCRSIRDHPLPPSPRTAQPAPRSWLRAGWNTSHAACTASTPAATSRSNKACGMRFQRPCVPQQAHSPASNARPRAPATPCSPGRRGDRPLPPWVPCTCPTLQAVAGRQRSGRFRTGDSAPNPALVLRSPQACHPHVPSPSLSRQGLNATHRPPCPRGCRPSRTPTQSRGPAGGKVAKSWHSLRQLGSSRQAESTSRATAGQAKHASGMACSHAVPAAPAHLGQAALHASGHRCAHAPLAQRQHGALQAAFAARRGLRGKSRDCRPCS